MASDNTNAGPPNVGHNAPIVWCVCVGEAAGCTARAVMQSSQIQILLSNIKGNNKARQTRLMLMNAAALHRGMHLQCGRGGAEHYVLSVHLIEP